jgi:hypothetical protein
LEELEKEISNVGGADKASLAKMRNSLKDLQCEHQQLKKILRAQIKHHQ